MRSIFSFRSLKTSQPTPKKIPLLLKLAYTGWIMVWIPLYSNFYGPQNFLWICDLGNIILLFALWTESSLLVSSQFVAVFLVDLLWTLDVGAQLLGIGPIIGGTEYMFNRTIPISIRILSLFHLFTPPLLVYLTTKLGYDRRGLLLQTLLTWIVLPLTFVLTAPERDINWVWGLFGKPQSLIDPLLYLFLLMAGYPLVVYIPTHGLAILGVRLGLIPENNADLDK